MLRCANRSLKLIAIPTPDDLLPTCCSLVRGPTGLVLQSDAQLELPRTEER
jgi:hypothetical protein